MVKGKKLEIAEKTVTDYIDYSSKRTSTEDVVLRMMDDQERRKSKLKKSRMSAAEEYKTTLVDGRWIDINGVVRQCRNTGVISYLNKDKWTLVEDVEDLPLSKYRVLMGYLKRRNPSQFRLMESANIKGDISKYINLEEK